MPGGWRFGSSRVYITGTSSARWRRRVALRVTERLRPPVRLVLTVIALAAIAEQQGFLQRHFAPQDFYGIADRIAPELKKGDAAYIVPRYTDTTGETLTYLHGEVFAMWAGMQANVPVVNGYSGRVPAGNTFPPYGIPITDDMLRTWLVGKFRGKLAIVDPDNPSATRVIVIE